eukprot:3589416-Rhodomonas_salina.1
MHDHLAANGQLRSYDASEQPHREYTDQGGQHTILTRGSLKQARVASHQIWLLISNVFVTPSQAKPVSTELRN